MVCHIKCIKSGCDSYPSISFLTWCWGILKCLNLQAIHAIWCTRYTDVFVMSNSQFPKSVDHTWNLERTSNLRSLRDRHLRSWAHVESWGKARLALRNKWEDAWKTTVDSSESNEMWLKILMSECHGVPLASFRNVVHCSTTCSCVLTVDEVEIEIASRQIYMMGCCTGRVNNVG
jgi:hypothetical protein